MSNKTDMDDVKADVRAFRDEDGEIDVGFVAHVERLIASANHDGLVAAAGQLHASDMGALLEALEADDRPRLIEILGKDFDFTALTEIDDGIREEILEELEAATVAEGMRDLDSDDAVYILEDMDPADKADILDRMSATDRIALQKSLDYPEGTAGRRMQTEIIAVPPFWTVGQTIDFMRETQDLPATFYELYVVDPTHRLVGTVSLDKLLRTRRPVRIATLADPERKTVFATDDLTDVAQMFKRYNFVSAPVLDEGERLVGIMTIDDIVDIIDEEADDEIKALGGVNADEELSDSVPEIARSRFQWLFINLLTAFVAASIMKLFEASIEKMVALAVLAPVVASQGGNAATQTMTVAVRALGTGELGNWNMSRFLTRELLVSFINGAAFALITGVVAAIWFTSPGLGMVIGLAIIANLFAAAVAGASIPIALDRLGVDPAVSSGTFVTTVTDVVGFFAFLGIATLWFRL